MYPSVSALLDPDVLTGKGGIPLHSEHPNIPEYPCAQLEGPTTSTGVRMAGDAICWFTLEQPVVEPMSCKVGSTM